MKKDYTYSLAAFQLDCELNNSEYIYNKYTDVAIRRAVRNGGKIDALIVIIIMRACIKAYDLMCQDNSDSVEFLIPEDFEAVMQNYCDYIVDCAQSEL